MVNSVSSFYGTKAQKLETTASPKRQTALFKPHKDVVSFGRALAAEKPGETGEIVVYSKLIQSAKEKLGLNNVMVILPSVSTPQDQSKNTGMGTLFSDKSMELATFLKRMIGMNTIQDMPEGQFMDKGNVSPFSGSVDALGVHLIDLHKLAQPAYGELVQPGEVKAIIVDSNQQSESQKNWEINYKHVLGDPCNAKDAGKQRQVLEQAFVNFEQKLKDGSLPQGLKAEYEAFLSQNQAWTEKNALYDVLSRKYGNTNIDLWQSSDTQKLEKDRNLYSGKYKEGEIQARIAEIKAECNESFKSDIPGSRVTSFDAEVAYSKFTQFVANKQLQETIGKLNEQDIKLFGDCLIGFSPREYWANKSAFLQDGFIGCIDNGQPKSWGLYSLDFNKPEARVIQEKKFELMNQRYNGLRIDSAYQLSEPVIIKRNGEVDRKYFGNDFYDMLEKVIKRVKGDKINYENYYFEMLGGPNGPADRTKNKWPHSQITRYAGGDWGRVSVYLGPGNGSQYGYSREGVYMGIGTHDDKSLIAQDAERQGWQKDMLAGDLKTDAGPLHADPAESRNARFAELFTARNPFFTVFDAMGIDTKFNEGWGKRLPENFKEFYYGQLAGGFGLNAPKALRAALKAKNPQEFNDNHPLMKALDKAGRILKSEGTVSEAQAKLDIEAGKITEKLTAEDLKSI